ncbi:MAG: DUF116 domain-containing protein [candidate division KSB1 bacterium]|nr:DUF116 domain-containing protein [candidate division KSB1 bacterium]MDZ7334332.1 DUF116 domain-containing protein [candidate division KSB1 bacterium]MDZ7356373.1 DUF116 domain-containing protein [candidate division KSB1 bacterium]MDZ7375311.1 DUF116 domain-containing protein [candidate division KSB1 bacterium]MDZ7399319.1 DUF116 domain-containing protein [candidate division KSB1 bacterium]
MKQDRKLGDEWVGWDGNLSDTTLHAETGKRLFLGLAILSILLVTLVLSTIWYLISPRVSQFHPAIATVIKYLILASLIGLILVFLQTVLSIVLRKNLLVRIHKKYFSITFLTPLILALGTKIGISYDRIGNSFIKVSNSLIMTTPQKISNSKILILLPRCLRRPIREQINAIAQKYRCAIFTVPGGELARKIIAENKPSAIIGVACERDLLSGIRDTQHIPVIGIPNERPEGPCKNTTVDYKKIEDALLFFLE